MERQKLKNSNPKGIRVPKFILFSENGVESILTKKSALSLSSQPANRLIQRYVVPSDFTANKLVVHWSKAQPTRVFSLIARSPIDSKPSDSSSFFNIASIASSRFLDICEVKREDRISNELEALTETVKGVVERFGTAPEEQLEEMIFSCMFTLGGKMVVLNCKKARVGVRVARGVVLSRRASLPRPEDLPGRSIFPLSRDTPSGKSLLLPPAPAAARRGSVGDAPDPVAAFASKHIAAAADSLDRTSEQGRERKQAAAELIQRVKLLGYPSWFVSQFISKAYDEISADPRLMHYFGTQQRIGDHLKDAMQQVFIEGSSQVRIRAIHRNMDIKDEHFQLYLKAFQGALNNAGANQGDVQKAMAYLTSFRGCIVANGVEEAEKQS